MAKTIESRVEDLEREHTEAAAIRPGVVLDDPSPEDVRKAKREGRFVVRVEKPKGDEQP